MKAAVQRDIAECIQQLAVFPQACEVLKADSKLIDAVKALVDKGWTNEAKETATRTLATFYPEQLVKFVVDEDSLHIMMSCKHSVSSSALCLLRQVDYLLTHAMDPETHWCCFRAKINGMCKRCVCKKCVPMHSTIFYGMRYLVLQIRKEIPGMAQIVKKIVAELQRRGYKGE